MVFDSSPGAVRLLGKGQRLWDYQEWYPKDSTLGQQPNLCSVPNLLSVGYWSVRSCQSLIGERGRSNSTLSAATLESVTGNDAKRQDTLVKDPQRARSR